jgi:O-antigen/teichoic acid export membrane protein
MKLETPHSGDQKRARQPTRLRSSVGSFGWGLADQMLSSVTNFLLGLLVAREVGPGEFGAFGLAYATYTLALGAGRTLASEPLLVRFSAGSNEQWRSAVAGAAGTSLVLGAIVGTLSLLVAAGVDEPLRSAFALLGIALPGLLVQDVWRFSFFARGRGAQAFWNDFVWAVVLFPGAALLLSSGKGSMRALMAVWAVAGLAAAAVGVAQTRVVPRPDRFLWWLREQRDLAFRFFGEFVVSSGATQLSLFLIGAVATLADVGRLRAGQMLLGPLNILFLGAGLVAVAETARLLAESPRKMDQAVRMVSALLTLGTVTWAAVALLLPAAIGEAVMGRNWVGGRALLLPLAIGATGHALASGPMSGLRALAAARSSLRARMFDAVFTLALGVTGAAVAGARGAAWGYAIAGCLRVPNWLWHFHEARRSYSATGRVPASPESMVVDATMPEETP